jgi:hypothetical protein
MTGILMMSVGNSYGSLPVNTVAPVVSGTATVGQTLTTTNGTWTGAPAPTFTYQWQRVTTNISGATSSTYVLVAADVGNTIRCVVTATNPLGAVSANSNATAAVAATVPGAPTIGTATATGSTTATVAFAAPASNGGATITSYTATSSPGGVTGTLNQAGSGTITVTGLSGGTSYTFTVTATNSAGTGPASAASNSITTLPSIGQAYAGGFFAGQISTTANGVATHNLVVGPRSTAQQAPPLFVRWKNSRTETPGADSDINGPQNTADMVADGNSTVYPAAHFCNNLVIGGFSDWYMPANNESDVTYFNLKPSTDNNGVTAGINPNSVPRRDSNYTFSVPPQTSAAAFQSGGAEAFSVTSNYWCSTERSVTDGWSQSFSNGNLSGGNKDGYGRSVRAIRRVAV